MTDEYRPVLRGLVTDPNRQVSGSDGLIECDNAMCKRIGLIEPRGGIAHRYSPVSSVDSYPNTVYTRDQWFVANNGTNAKVYVWGAGSATMSLAGTQQGMRAEPFADRQCWTFPSALRMLDVLTPSASSFVRLPGAPRAMGFYVSYANTGATATLLMGPQQVVAYRAVIVRHITTSQGDRIVIGAPSDRVVFWNISAVNRCDAVITFPIGTLAVGDEIQLYRTRLATATATIGDVDPGDEMMMRTSYRITTAPASSDNWTFTDSGQDGSWSGPSLYTNDTQQGIAQANYRIRVAKDVAFYNNMAFYAQGTPGQTKTIEMNAVSYGGKTSGPLPVGQSLQSFGFTGDTNTAVNSFRITNCNPTVTQMVANYGATVGMRVALATNDPLTSAGSPAFGTILTLDTGANMVALDTVNTANTIGTAFVAWDWVGIQLYSDGGPIYRVFAGPATAAGSTFPWSSTSGVFAPFPGDAASGYHSGGGFDMERAWAFRYRSATAEINLPRLYTAAPIPYPFDIGVPLRFEYDDNANAPGDSSFLTPFEVISSKPYAFSQRVGLKYSDNYCRSEREGGLARLYYSKVSEPESIPLPNYVDIGDLGSPIVRIVATTDRLYVFKSDGIWSVYGTSPEDLVVQAFDPSTRSISAVQGGVETLDTSPWYRKLGNTVFAWTNKGIFAVDTSGAHRIDDAIQSLVRSVTPVTGSGADITLTRAFSASSFRDSVVIFGAEATSTASNGFVFAYHVDSGTWSTWSSQLATPLGISTIFRGSGDSADGTMWLGVYNGIAQYTDAAQQYSAITYPGLPVSFSDTFAGPLAATNLAFTVATVSGANITISGATWAPIEGSIISKDGANYLVMSVSGGTYTLDRSGITIGTAAVSYWPVKQTITYAADTEALPQIDKFFVQSYFGFQNLRGGNQFEQRFRVRGETTSSDWVINQYPTDGTTTPLTSAIGLTTDQEFEDSLDIPTDQTRGGGLQVTMKLNQACVHSALDSLVLTYDNRSNRIGGRS